MEPNRPLILVVEDETDLLATVEYNLQRGGYRTVGATSGEKAVDLANERCPSLVLLDLNLPGLSGFDVCRKLRSERATRAVPILILTARDEEVDRVVAFALGVDDFMSKPFSMRELLLRVHALLRRSEGPPLDDVPDRGRLEVGPLAIDIDRRCGYVSGNEVALTHREFEFLRTLMQRPGRVQTRSRLLTDVWGSPDRTGRTVDTHVKRLRQKLGSAARMIRTVRGLGYCLDEA
jgi:two-component system phosphate regulon response regulator PhoB